MRRQANLCFRICKVHLTFREQHGECQRRHLCDLQQRALALSNGRCHKMRGQANVSLKISSLHLYSSHQCGESQPNL